MLKRTAVGVGVAVVVLAFETVLDRTALGVGVAAAALAFETVLKRLTLGPAAAVDFDTSKKLSNSLS